MLLSKESKLSNMKEKLDLKDLDDFSIRFRDCNSMEYSTYQPLFSNGKFNRNNFNSGVDLFIRNYIRNISKSAKLGIHYQHYRPDVFELSVSINKFNEKSVVLIYINILNNDCSGLEHSYTFNIQYKSYENHTSAIYCNNVLCSDSDYLFLLNFIQTYGLYSTKMGKIKMGYKFILDESMYAYKED